MCSRGKGFVPNKRTANGLGEPHSRPLQTARFDLAVCLHKPRVLGDIFVSLLVVRTFAFLVSGRNPSIR
jgi:hypothetical protein